VVVQFAEKELFVNAVKLASHAEANERCDVSVTLGDHDVFAANDTAHAQRGDLVQAVLFARVLSAHRLAHARQLARGLVRLFKHVGWVQTLQLSVN